MKPEIHIQCVLATLAFLTYLLAATSNAEQPRNLDFEIPSKTNPQHPADWFINAKNGIVALDTTEVYQGKYSLRMSRSMADSFSVASYTLRNDSVSGNRLRIRGYIRTLGVTDGYAKFWIQGNTTESEIRGTTPWQQIEISAPLYGGLRPVFGAFLKGIGTAHFDAIKYDILQVETPTHVSHYLKSAINIMRRHSLKRSEIDWIPFWHDIKRNSNGIQTIPETYPVIELALKKLGDNHSHLRTPIQNRLNRDEKFLLKQIRRRAIKGALLQNIAYIQIPGFSSENQEISRAFASQVQHLIAELDALKPQGWIVDLRTNTGGNMWPMLAGIGPILGEGKCGESVTPDRHTRSWAYENGKALSGNYSNQTIIHRPYHLLNPKTFVAVLIGPRTASSGEAITVAFKGRPDTRFFGTPTGGLTTANKNYKLSDGAQILLTVSTYADRNGNLYGDPVVPDEVIKSDYTGHLLSEDPVVRAAITYLKSQNQPPTGQHPY